ncbi:MAG TPA: ABC transporter substrate-binding protein [Burkholderiales bacterium]|jgi:phospholipid transport system substrate-binding protein|nr:ABC transporter substrate-binding protein [Burkholderiales bacterium]
MKKILSALALVALASSALAQDAAPDALVRSITQDVLAVLKQNSSAQDPKQIANIIEMKVLPHFELTRMTQLAMGRNWRAASPEQQKVLTAEFMTLLVRTYSTALASYRDQVIDVKPLRAAPNATDVTVKSDVKRPGSQPIAIDYDLGRTPAGWKVYDVKVGGVSLVTTYRETFANEVRENGIDGLIKSLSTKNRQSDARFGASKT